MYGRMDIWENGECVCVIMHVWVNGERVCVIMHVWESACRKTWMYENGCIEIIWCMGKCWNRCMEDCLSSTDEKLKDVKSKAFDAMSTDGIVFSFYHSLPPPR